MPNQKNLWPLGLGDSIDDLNEHAENVNVIITSDIQCRLHCLDVAELFHNAEARYQAGDEEYAYVLFMRLLYIFERIGRTREYQSKKREYNDIINVKNIRKAGERVEELSQSLVDRYFQRELERLVDLLNDNELAGGRRDERPDVDPVQEMNNQNDQAAPLINIDGDAEDPIPRPLGAAYAVEQNFSASELYLPVLASNFATSDRSSSYTGLHSPLSPEHYMMCFRRTENADDREYPYPQFGDACSLVYGYGTEMEGEFTASCTKETAEDLQHVNQELAYDDHEEDDD